MRRRFVAAGAAVTAALLLTGVWALPGRAQDDTAIASGSATASSVFLRYSDNATFFQGGTLGTVDLHVGYATGDIDLTGTSAAIAALGYSPYVDLPPAVNGLAGTNVDFEPFLSRARASITGQPPKEARASLVTPTDLAEAGTMEAHLATGPALEAFSTLARLEPAPATHIKSAMSRIKVTKVDGTSVTEATTILRSVSIAGLLTFDSISLMSMSVADGADGDARGSVTIDGGSVAGIPIAITEEGIRVADQVAPLELAAVKDALRSAGIELVGPSTVTLERGGTRSKAVATGPMIRMAAEGGQENTIELVLGQAVASSTLLAGFTQPPVPDLVPPVAPGPVAPPADFGGPVTSPPSTVGPPPAALGPGVVDLSRLALNDARSVDAFTALYGALAAGGMLVLAGVVLPRRRSMLEDRFR